MATKIWVNIGSGNGLLPDGNKPLPEPMLTDHQWSPVTFILGQFHNRCLNHQHWSPFENYMSKLSFNFPRGQWVNEIICNSSHSSIWAVIQSSPYHVASVQHYVKLWLMYRGGCVIWQWNHEYILLNLAQVTACCYYRHQYWLLISRPCHHYCDNHNGYENYHHISQGLMG